MGRITLSEMEHDASKIGPTLSPEIVDAWIEELETTSAHQMKHSFGFTDPVSGEKSRCALGVLTIDLVSASTAANMPFSVWTHIMNMNDNGSGKTFAEIARWIRGHRYLLDGTPKETSKKRHLAVNGPRKRGGSS
jgi:hypothetical protein